MKRLIVSLLMFVSGVCLAEEGDIHVRLQLPGTHGHITKTPYMNNKVYGAFIGYELPYNFIISAGAFENSIKDYGHNSGRLSNSFVLENRFYKTEDFSVYLRYRLANNYYRTYYKHSWSESAGLEGCYNVYKEYAACLSHTFWNEKTKATATGLALRAAF